jgi:outer membrane protein TolC
MVTTRFTGVGMVFAFLMFLSASGLRSGLADSPRAQAGEPKNAKIKKLLKERLAVVREIAKQTGQEYRIGKVSFDRVHQAQRAVLHARLELCESDKERLAVLEEALALATEYEKTAAQLYQTGRVPASDALQARAGRLEAEIAVERAKVRISAKSK